MSVLKDDCRETSSALAAPTGVTSKRDVVGASEDVIDTFELDRVCAESNSLDCVSDSIEGCNCGISLEAGWVSKLSAFGWLSCEGRCGIGGGAGDTLRDTG